MLQEDTDETTADKKKKKKESLHLLNKAGQYQERRESVGNHRSYFRVNGWETVV